MSATATQKLAIGFADLLGIIKNNKRLSEKTPPIQLVNSITEVGKASLSPSQQENIDFKIVSDKKLKNRMAQASEAKFKSLCNNAKNDIDRAKLSAYGNYALRFINAPIVIAVTSNSVARPNVSNMVELMTSTAENLSIKLEDLTPQLSPHTEFSQILGLKGSTQVVTILALSCFG